MKVRISKIFALMLVFMVSVSSSAASQAYEIRISSVFATDHPVVQAYHWFGEQLVERSDGRFSYVIFDNGVLAGGDREGIEITRQGTVQLTTTTAYTLALTGGAAANSQQFLQLPFVFDLDQQLYDFMSTEVGQSIIDDMQNAVGVGVIPGGFLQGTVAMMFRNVAVSSPEDLRGLRIRTPGAIMINHTIDQFGASPVAMAFGETYTALEQGTVDAAYSNVLVFYYQQIHDVARHLLIFDTKADLTVLIYNLDFVNSLPDDLKVIWYEALIELNQKLRDDLVAAQENSIERLREIIETVHIPEGEEFGEWQNIGRQAWGPAIETMGYDFFERAMNAAGVEIPEMFRQ